MKRLWVTIAAVANLVLLDGIVKELTLGYLRGRPPIPVVEGWFDLACVLNFGCAWGMLQGQVWPLAIFGVIALGVLVWKRRAFFGDSYVIPCFLYAGIIGNLIDRVFRGYVVDMFDFHWGAHHFPCFNIADSLITVAAALMILSSFRHSGK